MAFAPPTPTRNEKTFAYPPPLPGHVRPPAPAAPSTVSAAASRVIMASAARGHTNSTPDLSAPNSARLRPLPGLPSLGPAGPGEGRLKLGWVPESDVTKRLRTLERRLQDQQSVFSEKLQSEKDEVATMRSEFADLEEQMLAVYSEGADEVASVERRMEAEMDTEAGMALEAIRKLQLKVDNLQAMEMRAERALCAEALQQTEMQREQDDARAEAARELRDAENNIRREEREARDQAQRATEIARQLVEEEGRTVLVQDQAAADQARIFNVRSELSAAHRTEKELTGQRDAARTERDVTGRQLAEVEDHVSASRQMVEQLLNEVSAAKRTEADLRQRVSVADVERQNEFAQYKVCLSNAEQELSGAEERARSEQELCTELSVECSVSSKAEAQEVEKGKVAAKESERLQHEIAKTEIEAVLQARLSAERSQRSFAELESRAQIVATHVGSRIAELSGEVAVARASASQESCGAEPQLGLIEAHYAEALRVSRDSDEASELQGVQAAAAAERASHAEETIALLVSELSAAKGLEQQIQQHRAVAEEEIQAASDATRKAEEEQQQALVAREQAVGAVSRATSLAMEFATARRAEEEAVRNMRSMEVQEVECLAMRYAESSAAAPQSVTEVLYIDETEGVLESPSARVDIVNDAGEVEKELQQLRQGEQDMCLRAQRYEFILAAVESSAADWEQAARDRSTEVAVAVQKLETLESAMGDGHGNQLMAPSFVQARLLSTEGRARNAESLVDTLQLAAQRSAAEMIEESAICNKLRTQMGEAVEACRFLEEECLSSIVAAHSDGPDPYD